MNDTFDNLKNQWKDAKQENPERPSIAEMIRLSEKKMKSTVNMQMGNIAILSITFIGISAFFIYVAPLQDTLSHVGIGLMLGGLLLRILIECVSIYRSTKLDMGDTANLANQKTLSYHAYRKRIHGSVTIGILAAYTIGFYVLTPEFARYFTTPQVVLMDLSYLVAAAIFGFSIRKAIKTEMRVLDELKELQEELGKE